MNTAFVEYISRNRNHTSLSNFLHPDDIIGDLYCRYVFNVELNEAFLRKGLAPIDLSRFDEVLPRFKNISLKTMADSIEFCSIEDNLIRVRLENYGK